LEKGRIMKSTKPSYNLVMFGVLLTVAVVVLGAFTRLKDAGLGCPDWPTCYGHYMLWPETAEEIAAANALHPEFPFDETIAWPEVVHRYFATTLGLVIIGITLIAWRNRHSYGQPMKLPLFLLGLVIAQGLFGMWTVTLKLWPQVVTAHLLGGFSTLSLLWLLAMRLDNRSWARPDVPLLQWESLKRLALGGLVLVVLQILLGGWTSSNYAALACPDLPTCQGQWLPPMDFTQGFNVFQEIGPNYLGGQMDGEARVAIHFMHRVGAIVVSLYLLFLITRMRKVGGGADMHAHASLMFVLLLIQVGLGISNVVWSLPLAIAVAHNAVGALLLLSLVTLNYRLHRGSSW
jgi:cytochrome c oxidase assembly protein subunit 15